VTGRARAVAAALLVASAARPAAAIDRECPPGQSWSASAGKCVRSPEAPARRGPSPAQKYASARRLLLAKGKPAAPDRIRSLLDDACHGAHWASCVLLGELLVDGRRLPFEPAPALAAFVRACRAGQVQACMAAAELHERRLVDDGSAAAAAEFWRAACELKHGPGCFRAGLHRDATGGDVGGLFETAYELLRSECRVHGRGCVWLAAAYERGRGTDPDPSQAKEALARGCRLRDGDACGALAAVERRSGDARAAVRAAALYERACYRLAAAASCEELARWLHAEPALADPARARAAAQRACDLDVAHCAALADLLDRGPADEQQPVSELVAAACARGSAQACYRAGARRRAAGAGAAGPEALAAGVALWNRACELGSAEACGDLGFLYYRGADIPVDLRRAFVLHGEACARGHGPACFYAGEQIDTGRDGTDQARPSEAVAYYEASCALQHGPGCIRLARFLLRGTAVPADPERGRTLLERSCDFGDGNACVELGNLYYRAEGVAKDELVAALAFERACSLGIAQPCFWLDSLFARGQATEEQRAHAASSLRQACAGAPPNEGACRALAGLHIAGGLLVAKNQREGFGLINDSCARGDQLSCSRLAQLYRDGIGVVRDVDRAKQLFKEQCDGAAPQACVWLGLQLWRERKYEDAVRLFGRSCDEGEGHACALLGDAHASARGVTWDMAAATRLYERGCELQEPAACAALGRVFEHGFAAAADPARAFEYYQKGCTPTSSAGCGPLGRMLLHRAGHAANLGRGVAELERACADDSTMAAAACWTLADHHRDSAADSEYRVAALIQRAFDLARKCSVDDSSAQHLLGLMYRHGVGVVRSPEQAADAFEAACAGYDPLGCRDAGQLFFAGEGVDRDYERAQVYFQRACAAGLRDECARAKLARQAARRANQPALPMVSVRGQRGCGCRAAADPKTGLGPWLCAGLAGFVWRRQRRK
jgi:uncharacterized protein